MSLFLLFEIRVSRTARIGTRVVDLLHVAAAVELKANCL
jgi:hypothetical protein